MKLKLSKNFSIDGTTLIIVIIIIAAVVYFTYFRGDDIDDTDVEITAEIAQCIGSNSLVYVSSTCHVCAEQKAMFGDYYKYLNTIDCVTDGIKCSEANINGVPTWIIDGKRSVGLQSIKKLMSLTGCSD